MTQKNLKKQFFSNSWIWCFSTYFAEGFPYSIIRMVSSFFFRTMNVSLESIGLTSFFGLPWILKFLWAPQIDRFLTKRWWLILMQAALSGVFLLCGIFVPFSWSVGAIAVLFMIGAILAATHDTAIDGYYLVALNSEDQTKFIGYRVLAYRCALMTGTGLIATLGTTKGWGYAFIGAGVLLALLTVYHLFCLPRCQSSKYSLSDFFASFLTPRFVIGALSLSFIAISLKLTTDSLMYKKLAESIPVFKNLGFAAWINIFLFGSLVTLTILRKKIVSSVQKRQDSYYVRAFSSFMAQEQIGLLLAFIIFLRTGEILLSNMVSPFLVDCGVKVHYGWISAGIGLPSSIVGALLGGYLISRFSLQKMMFPFLLLQNGTNLIYMWLGFYLKDFLILNTGVVDPTAVGNVNLAIIASVHGFDQISGGLGTSVLMTFLIRICKGESKAAHYAIGSGLMNLSGLFMGALSGFLAARFGYGYFFGISFLASVPGMILAIPLIGVIDLDGDKKNNIDS